MVLLLNQEFLHDFTVSCKIGNFFVFFSGVYIVESNLILFPPLPFFQLDFLPIDFPKGVAPKNVRRRRKFFEKKFSNFLLKGTYIAFLREEGGLNSIDTKKLFKVFIFCFNF